MNKLQERRNTLNDSDYKEKMSGNEAEEVEIQEEAPVAVTNKTGTGKFQFPDGALYEGEWMEIKTERLRHGTGKYTDGDEIYEGMWVNDSLTGDSCMVRLTFAKTRRLIWLIQLFRVQSDQKVDLLQ